MYLKLLLRLINDPDYRCAPRGQRIHELLNYQFTVVEPDERPIVTLDPDRNKVIADYTARELALYESGTRSAEEFAKKGSRFWAKLANPDGTINSNYGWLIFHKRDCGDEELERSTGGTQAGLRTPWEWAKQALLADADTRQALMFFSRPEFLWVGNKDQVCMLHGQFFIRRGRLHLATVIRSNDVWYGLSYDTPFLCHLQARMLRELREAGMEELSLGSWTHMAHSLHLYERNLFDAARAVGFTTEAAGWLVEGAGETSGTTKP